MSDKLSVEELKKSGVWDELVKELQQYGAEAEAAPGPAPQSQGMPRWMALLLGIGCLTVSGWMISSGYAPITKQFLVDRAENIRLWGEFLQNPESHPELSPTPTPSPSGEFEGDFVGVRWSSLNRRLP